MSYLDDIDLKILRQLQNNSNLTTKELAKTVNLSPTPVFDRVKRLEKDGFIKRYVAILDAEKLEKGFCVFCNVKLKQHNQQIGYEFMEAIQQVEEVTECYNISGDFDFMLKIYVKSMKHYQDFVLNKLGTIDSLGSLHSNFVLGVVKQDSAIPI
ncbi:MAG: Lrp/AsnC family transcriptional regulator [Bacteroidales bacterium]